MRIWFAADVAPDSCGGVRRVMEKLGEGLQSRGHTVTIVTAPSAEMSYLRFSLHLMLQWFAARPRPDWVIARSSDGLFSILLCRLLGGTTQFALHNHGWEEKVYETERQLTGVEIYPATTWKSRVIRFPLLRTALRLSTLCVSGTVSETRWLRNHYPHVQTKLRLVPTGTDIPQTSYWSTRDSIPHAILFIGASTWKKNLDGALALFEKIRLLLPDASWYGIGTGPISPAVRARAGADSVWVENEAPDAMSQWYRLCPFLLSTSRYEGGHAMVLLEAMSFGAVPFVSPIDSSLEIVRDGHNGFVLDMTATAKSAQSIVQTMTNPATVCRVGLAAYRTAQRNRWDRWVSRLEGFL